MGRVIVAGSINMDVVAKAERHPRIGETVAGDAVIYSPGGKGANQAVAAAKLGAPTTLVGRVGTDAFGLQLRTFLAAQGVDIGFVKDTTEAHTGTAIITLADADNTIVVIPGANGLLSGHDVAAPGFTKGDIAVSQFEIPLATVAAFFQRARAAGATTILNPAPAKRIDRALLDLVDILILNETELGFLTGRALSDRDPQEILIDAARSLQTREDQVVCVTLGKRGIAALVEGRLHFEAGRPVKAIDTTGAGDCFVGAVASILADGMPLQAAISYANIAASICVQRMGAGPAMPTVEEVKAVLAAERSSKP